MIPAHEVRQKIIEAIELDQHEKPHRYTDARWHFHKYYWEDLKPIVEVVVNNKRFKISVEEIDSA